VDVDEDKVLKQGVPIGDVYKTIQASWRPVYQLFQPLGRQWQVYIEAEGAYRTRAENVGQFYVRNNTGEMVPLSALTRFESRPGPEFTMRFNMYRSAQINARLRGIQLGAGHESARRSVRSVHAARDGLRLQGHVVPGEAGPARRIAKSDFRISLLFVFLILAALYESWSLPFRRVVEYASGGVRSIFCAVAAARYIGRSLPALHGADRDRRILANWSRHADRPGGQNAILIVEFAKDEFEKGKPLVDAALEGARLRLRPILMTSFAFILGCVPLWTATGADR